MNEHPCPECGQFMRLVKLLPAEIQEPQLAAFYCRPCTLPKMCPLLPTGRYRGKNCHMTTLPKCPNCGRPMIEAQTDTVALSPEVLVFECDRCNVTYFSEDHVPIAGAPSRAGR